LATHRVDGHNAPLQREHLQQLRDRLNLVRSVFGPALAEHQLLTAGPRLYQVERAFSGDSVSASPKDLPVDGDDLPVGLFFDSARLCPKAALEVRRLDLAEHPGQRVMRRHSVFERKQAPKPAELRLPELGDGTKTSAPLIAPQIARRRISFIG
jgi:hypothetical protein